jgi:YesN/AraC family two-component response regulator
MALEMLPDLIISDIMMPEMDGYEVCRILKNDFRTSHIPIIMLTAKADFESKIAGLKTGADYYLTKPFERAEIKTIIQNLIENREKLKSKFRSMVMMPDKADIKSLNPDETFLNKLRGVMDNHYSDDHFGTVQLTREMGMSRVQLFRKLKALTGLSASTFMRIYRLTAARNKIEKTKLTISEIAYQSGFSDPAHFSHAFNQEFGMSPSEARKKTQENETSEQVT